MQLSRHRGFSAVATVIITAVIIGGAVATVSLTGGGGTSEMDSVPATSTGSKEADNEVTSSQQTAETKFVCADEQTVRLQFTGEAEADLTLPDGSVVSVSRAQSGNATVFQSSDGSVMFRNAQEGGAVIEQEGEVVASGCASASAHGHGSANNSVATSSAKMDNEAGAESEASANTGVGNDSTTTSQDDIEVDTSAETEAQLNVGTETDS